MSNAYKIVIKNCDMARQIYIYVISDIKFLVILMYKTVLHECGIYINVKHMYIV